jgi:pimeloyl-ACP methyl ester carboxylesterase
MSLFEKLLLTGFVISLHWATLAHAESQEEYHLTQPYGPPPVTLPYIDRIERDEVYFVPASPENGFYWPYFFTVPKMLGTSPTLLIQPNNDGLTGISPESRAYFASIFNQQAGIDFGRPLGVIVLTPVFPRPALDTADDNLYVHALSRESMLAEEASLYRIDLQLLAMAKDLARVLAKHQIELSDRFLLWGFSAAGDFVSRFTSMHPRKVKALAAGGMGGLPILPVSSYQGATLNYPVGVADFPGITGSTFDLASFRQVPMLFLQGSEDDNDSVVSDAKSITASDYASDSYSRDQSIWINRAFGEHPMDRIDKVREVYRAVDMQRFDYVVVDGVKHKDRPLKPLVRDFFKQVLDEFHLPESPGI